MIALNPWFIYVSDWIQNCSHTHIHSLHPGYQCAPLLIVPLGTPYGRCWKIYCCHSWFCLFFFKCAALHNDGVGKILPYYPIKVRTFRICSFHFQTARLLHHFPPVLRDAPLRCCTTICWGCQPQKVLDSHLPPLPSPLPITEIDFSVCHWWHCTTAVFEWAAVW